MLKVAAPPLSLSLSIFIFISLSLSLDALEARNLFIYYDRNTNGLATLTTFSFNIFREFSEDHLSLETFWLDKNRPLEGYAQGPVGGQPFKGVEGTARLKDGREAVGGGRPP